MNFRTIASAAFLSLALLGWNAQARAAMDASPAAPGKNESLSARLVDKDKNASMKAATVEVKVKGVSLVDPDKAHEQPKAGEGHIHYQVDDGPIVATPDKKISFHNLTSGNHRITVMLAGNDHSPLGPQQTLEVTVP